jgi:acetylornithine deacetylase/succinyl-diaminopimelate desuccinylase-like protein
LPPDDTARVRVGASRREQVVDFARRLMAAGSPNPPGDTREVAAVAADGLRRAAPGIDVAVRPASDLISNVVARVHGRRPGRRIVFNGHLDTYPVGDLATWTVDPVGEVRGERLYGRGSADMKGGIAASMAALVALASEAEHWSGEAVLTLGGDEETMGPLGTRRLMDEVPHATGDWVIIGDAGSPRVLRFGEKGFLWIEIEAAGRPAHRAHVHLGTNAIDRLRRALDRLDRAFEALVPTPPDEVRDAIRYSAAISEPLAGEGEAATLERLTVNVGTISGGTSLNLVPRSARAEADIGIPVGLTVEEVEAALAGALDREGVCYRVLRRFAPSFTPPQPSARCPCGPGGGRGHGGPRRRQHAGRRLGFALVPDGRRADGRLRPDPLRHGRVGRVRPGRRA